MKNTTKKNLPKRKSNNDNFSQNRKKSSKKKRPEPKRSHEKSDSESEFEEVSEHMDKSGFPMANNNVHSDSDMDEATETRKLISQHNKNKKAGGFQAMGLSHSVMTGITRKGYKLPTPIQRKTIPIIMDCKDVVAMARTGSGKTAAFLIPLFEKLKQHTTTGARAIIMAPTRELALQTLKFTKEIGKYTGLRAAVILGGDSMEEQFAAIHENPDIIIATPGRFMHVCVEMDLKLSCVEYMVFDEADRLFEMGFQEQLHEIIKRVPESRQTLLFSATLPKLLVEFARAGLHDPTLVRLDVDTKLSEHLKTSYLQCRMEDKLSVLLYLLQHVIKPTEQTVIFAATKHHVEYLYMVLTEAGYSSSYSYSSLDQTARKINVAKFRNNTTSVLLVTDLAARGIDIPMLDNVINFNFPAKPKLFVHRVGRVARAGRTGTAYSLVSPDEVPLVLDLHLALGRPMKYVVPDKKYTDTDALYGWVPQSVIDDVDEMVQNVNAKYELVTLKGAVDNAQQGYIRSRPPPSKESVKRVKERASIDVGFHPMFGSTNTSAEKERSRLIETMKSFKPRSTIFEINSNKKNEAFGVMKKKRKFHSAVIETSSIKNQEQIDKFMEEESSARDEEMLPQVQSTEGEIQDTFRRVVAPKFDPNVEQRKFNKALKKKQNMQPVKDEENFVSYLPKDYHTERAMNLGNSFERDAAGAELDIHGDDGQVIKRMNNALKWDRKRKKYVRETGKELQRKKIKTESGQWIAASYKSNIYKEWLGKSKVVEQSERLSAAKMDENDGDSDTAAKPPSKRHSNQMEVYGSKRIGFHRQGMPGFPSKKLKVDISGNIPTKKAPRAEMRPKDEIIKRRKQLAKKKAHQKFTTDKRSKSKPKQGKKGGRR